MKRILIAGIVLMAGALIIAATGQLSFLEAMGYLSVLALACLILRFVIVLVFNR